MNINFIGNGYGAGLGKLLDNPLDGVGQAEKLSEPGQVVEGERVFTVTNASGKAVASTSGVPELEPAEIGDEYLEEIQSLEEKLKEISEDVGKIKASDLNSTAGVVRLLFDISQLLALMLEVANVLKKASMAARLQGHLAKQASLGSQAEALDSASFNSYVLGLVSAGVSAATTCASIGMSIVSFNKTTTAAGETNAAGVESQLNDIKSQQSALQQQQQVLDTGDVKLSSGQTVKQTALSQETQTALENYDKAKAEVTNAQSALDGAKSNLAKAEASGTKAEIEQAQAEVNGAQAKLTEAQKAFDGAKTKCIDSLNKDIANIQSQIDAAEKNVDKKTGDVSKEDLKNLKSELKFAETLKEVVESDIDPKAAMANLEQQVNELESQLQSSLREFDGLLKLNGASKYEALSQIMSNIGHVCSQILNTVAERQKEIGQVKAKEMESQQEGYNAELESANELVQGIQELINLILRIFQQIIDLENQSMQAAIRA